MPPVTIESTMEADDDERVVFAPESEVRDAVERLFARVAARLQRLIPNADVQHVGSTAIPGALTKGDLDVQVRVDELDYAAAKEKLIAVYSVNHGGFNSDDAISFEADDSDPSLGIHLTVIGGPADMQWKFRDLLIESPQLLAEYDRLKREFDGGSMEKYREAKAQFVARVLKDAAIAKAFDE
jgi:GrpB-like predicted nucleotidyltransferase (UPF0157 family)